MASATAPPKPSNPIITFYGDTGVDGHGRSLASILRWEHRALEDSHNYIQVLFPLPERSPNNYFAPVIDNEVFEAFRSRVELRARLRESFKKILWFFGFELRSEDGQIYVRDMLKFWNLFIEFGAVYLMQGRYLHNR